MNNICLIGRLTKEPEIRYSSGENTFAYGNYTLAVDRPKRKDAEQVTDFLFCKVVGKNAEFAEKHLHKGMKIGVTGRMQVDNYKDQDGNNKSTTYVQVLNQEFCESKSSSVQQTTPEITPTNGDGFMNIPDGIDEELPFN